MKILLFTPRSFIQTEYRQNYCLSGYLTLDIIESQEDLDACIFASVEHYKIYETLKELGTWRLVDNGEDY